MAQTISDRVGLGADDVGAGELAGGLKLPIDMALNHGVYSSPRCLEALRRYDSDASLRYYPAPDNRELREAIAAAIGVGPANISVANGSGPLLKSCLPYVIQKRIRQSPRRVVRHLLAGRGYPIITPRFTYFKVPHGAQRLGLKTLLLPMSPANGFALDVAELRAVLRRQEALVYLSNPNNPTGGLLLGREEISQLLGEFPQSTFVIDEAYAEYLSPERYPGVADLAARHPNLIVLRSFSFAYGLAAARVGYLVADAGLVADLDAKATPHQVGRIASDLVIAALDDADHLPRVRRATAEQRDLLIERLRAFARLEVYDSETNFILCRLRNGGSAADFCRELLSRGIKLKVFEPLQGQSYADYFRITLGLPAENEFLVDQIQAVLG